MKTKNLFKIISVTPTASASELFVAVPSITGKSLRLDALSGENTHIFLKDVITFEDGKYYEIRVRMPGSSNIVYNETELKAAVGKYDYIILGDDIKMDALE